MRRHTSALIRLSLSGDVSLIMSSYRRIAWSHSPWTSLISACKRSISIRSEASIPPHLNRRSSNNGENRLEYPLEMISLPFPAAICTEVTQSLANMLWYRASTLEGAELS